MTQYRVHWSVWLLFLLSITAALLLGAELSCRKSGGVLVDGACVDLDSVGYCWFGDQLMRDMDKPRHYIDPDTLNWTVIE